MLEAHIYDPTYSTQLGDGPLHPIRARIRRRLDGIGGGDLTISADDPRAADLLQVRRIVELWRYADPDSPRRRVGAFSVEALRFADDTRHLVASGPDLMQRLKDKMTLPGLIYDNLLVRDVLKDLASMAGFTLQFSHNTLPYQRISVRFDGDSLLRAIQVICETQGVHLRLLDGLRIEVGAFGDASGLRAQQMTHTPPELPANTLLPERVELVSSSSDVVNWLLPLGAGAGDAALTLANSTYFDVQTLNRNGRTHYYLKDDASIAQYGQIERRLNVKRLAPIAATDDALRDAANALYDAANAYLERHSSPQDVLRLALRPANATLRPGDRLHLAYNGVIEQDGKPHTLRDFTGDYWLLTADETYSNDAPDGRITLEISNVDRYAANAADIVVGKLDEIDVQNIFVQPTLNHFAWGPYQQEIDSSNPVTLKLRVRDATIAVNRALLIVRTVPFTSTAQAASSTPSSHEHLTMRSNDGTPAGGMSTQRFTIVEQSTGFLYHFDALSDVGPGTRFFSMQPSGTHTHDLQYGIQRDSSYPGLLTVTVNGDTVATTIGNTLSALEAELDITDAIRDRVGGFRAAHDISITCGAGQGVVIVECLIEDQIAQVRL